MQWVSKKTAEKRSSLIAVLEPKNNSMTIIWETNHTWDKTCLILQWSWDYALFELRQSSMAKKGWGWKEARDYTLALANSQSHTISSSKPSDVWRSASRPMDGSTRGRPKQYWRTSTEQPIRLSKAFEVDLLICEPYWLVLLPAWTWSSGQGKCCSTCSAKLQKDGTHLWNNLHS